MFSNSIFSSLGTQAGATQAAIFMLVVLAAVLLIRVSGLPLFQLALKLINWLMKVFGKFINKQEENYHRDVEIGKIDEKRKTYKLYNFLNELIIDLDLKRSGVTPYELLFLVCIFVFFGTGIICKMLFGTFLMVIIMFPVVIIGVFCVMYTKANVAHDRRIENVIEAENIICNNIKSGVLVAVRDSLDVIPKEIRPDFKDFIDNIEQQNYHVKTALLELNAHLGSVADDFIKKCIIFEMEEEHGIAGMFQDIVEINNINMEMRTEMKRAFEEVKFNFQVGAGMIVAFLAGVLAIYPTVREFYFTNAIGQFIIAIDILLFILEYVYITYLRAQEL
jgi:hypothetical protein